MSADRITALRTEIENRRRTADQAQAHASAAQESLNRILSEHGVSTVEELEARAAEAQTSADEALARAEAALS